MRVLAGTGLYYHNLKKDGRGSTITHPDRGFPRKHVILCYKGNNKVHSNWTRQRATICHPASSDGATSRFREKHGMEKRTRGALHHGAWHVFGSGRSIVFFWVQDCYSVYLRGKRSGRRKDKAFFLTVCCPCLELGAWEPGMADGWVPKSCVGICPLR